MNIGLKTTLAALLTTAALHAYAATETVPAGNQTRVESSQPSAVQALVRSAMRQYFTLWTSQVHTQLDSTFHENVSLKYTLSIPEINGVLEGRESIGNQVAAVAQLASNWSFDDVKLFPTNDPNTYFVQYTARATLRANSEKFARPALVIVETDGSQVVRVQELSNPAIAESTEAGALRNTNNLAHTAQ